MNTIYTVAAITWFAGITAYVGGLLARYERTPETEIKDKVIHGVVAFGGGTLISAVAYALLPSGIQNLSVLNLSLIFLAGSAVFCFLDQFLTKRGGAVSQFLAMLMDFIPEAMALGAVFASNSALGMLLAGFIAIQNFPEGFNAYREMVQNKVSAKTVLRLLFFASLLGPVAAVIGHVFLREQAELTAGIMTFASGGILYLIFQDIAPQSAMRGHWSPPFGAVLGFLLGVIGHMLVHG
ncbi:divalent cation transporter [Ketobacter sp. MCCC 1A13808]|uniref:ZIP family metal transporter n=1 Tax=Ketobacter sp. MCCC 1A13808 TaxID=2602738 RepID=UPI0012EB09E3|nr:ZIP family metal transporter [Ketobacter sp. MCCC 1A13808]MVF10661.1 divalent cation transporter [Ketobacter sp. MCCC 1A13808]